MKKKRLINNFLFILYTVIELVFYILLCFNFLENEDVFNYGFIITNFIVSLIIFISIIKKNKSIGIKNIFTDANLFNVRYSFLITIGLFFTVLADYCLIVKGDYKELGVIFFTMTQLSYMFLIRIDNKNTIKNHLFKNNILLYIIMIIIMEISAIIVTKSYFNFLVAITMNYISIFIINIVLSIYKKTSIIFTIGLILFIFCDICVGLSCFEMFNNETLIRITSILIYIFYLPGQYLIVLSEYVKSKKG